MNNNLEYNGWTEQKLNEFNDEIIKIYETGKIRAPIHLSGDNASYLIKVFSDYKITPRDYVLSTWRSHFHWLLSGRNPEELKKQIVEGHSMHIYGDRFITSAIVGGISSIGVGIAMGLKMNKSKDRVFVLLGDMGALCGISNESIIYSCGQKLPIFFIIENNNLSVNAKVQETLGCSNCSKVCDLFNEKKDCVIKYDYKRTWPHAGTGAYVMF